MSRRAVAGLEGSVWPSSLQQIMSPTPSQHQVILPRPGDSLEMIEQVLGIRLTVSDGPIRNRIYSGTGEQW